MGRQNSNLRKIGSRPSPLADWSVGASVGTARPLLRGLRKRRRLGAFGVRLLDVAK
jgi:hypothetical protein